MDEELVVRLSEIADTLTELAEEWRSSGVNYMHRSKAGDVISAARWLRVSTRRRLTNIQNSKPKKAGKKSGGKK